MKRRRDRLGLWALIGALLMSGTVLVQAAPGRQGSGGACDVEHLVAEQAEYAALLADFEHVVGDDLDAALGALYEVGHAYQHLAEECGFVPPEDEHAEHGAAEAGETEEMSETDMAMETLRRTDPATYIRLSILSPNAYVVPGFLASLMPQSYGQVFTPEEINDLVAYVLTLSE